MCNADCFKWGINNLSRSEIEGKRILEVGSHDVNGTLRYVLEALGPGEYVGVDINPGPGVDVVCAAEKLVEKFGKDSFDVVLSTCVLEHVRDWKSSVSNIKNICRPNGIILLIVPSNWPLHEYPYDFWRYDKNDLAEIFSDCEIMKINEDIWEPSLIYAKIKKSGNFVEKDLSGHNLYSMIKRKRVNDITDNEIDEFQRKEAKKKKSKRRKMRKAKWYSKLLGRSKSAPVEDFMGSEAEIVSRFHKLYYSQYKRTWQNTYWLGVTLQKNPLDLWVYQEILFEVKPDVIIETGTNMGGSALYLASICDLLGKGRILTIDIEHKEGRPSHPRITYLTGSSVEQGIVEKARQFAAGSQTTLVILDSDHSKDHVLKELNNYFGMVTRGSYLIVEDTNVNGHVVLPEFGPGPMEAIDEFIKGRRDFYIDSDKEKFYFTFNPRGFLLKIK